MRNRSTIDMVVEDTLRELEYEFENGEGVEFDSPSSVPNYKWMIYTSTSLSGGPWKLIGQEIAPKWMDRIDAGKYGKALLITKAFLRKIMPLGIARIAIQRCVRDENGVWKHDLGNCRQVEIAKRGISISGCEGRPFPPPDC